MDKLKRKCNTLTAKNPVGRPRLWNNVDELQKKIDEFFAWVEEKGKPQTLERLACFLDCSLMTLRRYEMEYDNDEFCAAIKKAKKRISAYQTELLIEGKRNPAGIIFAKKNNEPDLYSDTQTFEHQGKIIYFSLSAAELPIDEPKTIECELIKDKNYLQP